MKYSLLPLLAAAPALAVPAAPALAVPAVSGKRVRFLGVNLVGQGAFPTYADAEKMAARMAKLGINLVCLHQRDNPGWGTHSNLWDARFTDRQHIDPEQLDRLDYLIAQLK